MKVSSHAGIFCNVLVTYSVQHLEFICGKKITLLQLDTN